MFIYSDWIKVFKEHYQENGVAYNDASNYGITIDVHEDTDFVILGVHHLSGRENMGKHHIFCDVIDKNNQRMYLAKLEMKQGNLVPVFATIDKPTNEPGTNFPVWGEAKCSVSLSEFSSDVANGFRINHITDGPGNSLGHHSFFICFQENEGGTQLPPTDPDPDPEPPLSDVSATIKVTANIEWLNTLPKDDQGNITFEVRSSNE